MHSLTLRVLAGARSQAKAARVRENVMKMLVKTVARSQTKAARVRENVMKMLAKTVARSQMKASRPPRRFFSFGDIIGFAT